VKPIPIGVGDTIRYFGEKYPALTWSNGVVCRVPAKDTGRLMVESLKNGKKYWISKDRLQLWKRRPNPPGTRPYVKLLKERRIKTLSQIVILPVGRCLRMVAGSRWTGGWTVEVDDDEGHIFIRSDDPTATVAVLDDLINEPEDNDYESYHA